MCKVKFYQIVNISEFYCCTWTDNLEDAEKELKGYEETWPNSPFEIIEGTEYIRHKCRGCETPYADEKWDAHGITTGIWCEQCYNSDKYPYRKDKYPTIENDGYGEQLHDPEQKFFSDLSSGFERFTDY